MSVGLRRACYRCKAIEAERLVLRVQVKELLNNRRSSADSRTTTSMLKEKCVVIGRLNSRRLMGNLGMIGEKPSPTPIKNVTVGRPSIPKYLACKFTIERPKLGLVRRYHLYFERLKLELFGGCSRHAPHRLVGCAMPSSPDTNLTVKALDHAWEQRGITSQVMFHSGQGCQCGYRRL